MSGASAASGFELVGTEGQNWALFKRELYLVCWSAVRGGRVAGVEVGVGWTKGVLTGVVEPSTVAFGGVIAASEGAAIKGTRASVICAVSGACPLGIYSVP